MFQERFVLASICGGSCTLALALVRFLSHIPEMLESQPPVGPLLPLRARKKTKIVATIGPSSEQREVLRDMIQSGMNVVRFNMSHGDHASHFRRLQLVREISSELDHPIAVLVDLQGPKIRIGKLAGDEPVEWTAGELTVITVADCPDGTRERVGTTYAGLAADVKPGETILVDDGRLRLQVESVDGDDVVCRIIVGGILRSSKGINLPGVDVSTSSLSEKDKADLSWAIANDVEFVALSFVRCARDVRNLRNRIAETGYRIPIIAKIERAEAVRNIDEILAEADGIMVARGDLGIELSIEKLPIIQKELILRAAQLGRLVITATQMLESMIEDPIPTRAEATDVANAVFDGTDAVMLSAETASGRHPVASIREMTSILLEAERSRYLPEAVLDQVHGPFDKTTMTVTGAAHSIVDSLDAAGFLLFSDGMTSALLLSKRRNLKPAIVVCHDERTWRTYCLYWGIVALLVPRMDDVHDLLEAALDGALHHEFIQEGQLLVVLYNQAGGGVVQIKLHRV